MSKYYSWLSLCDDTVVGEISLSDYLSVLLCLMLPVAYQPSHSTQLLNQVWLVSSNVCQLSWLSTTDNIAFLCAYYGCLFPAHILAGQ